MHTISHFWFCYSLLRTLLFLRPVGLILEENMKIGSRPPGCVNKCMTCRPCMAAAAVVPVHKMKGKAFNAIASSREEVGSYYLLSWKCQCGNKIYQP